MSADKQSMMPYYEINLSAVRENLRSFTDVGFTVAYSIKANNDANIIKTVSSLGAIFEASSEWEYEYLRRVGVTPSSIIANLCCCSRYGLAMMIEEGALVVVDSVETLVAIADLGVRAKIGLRVNLDGLKVGDEYKNRQSRFGLNVLDDSVKAILKANSQIEVVCLHCHFSGNTRSPQVYASISGGLLAIAKRFPNVRQIDVGGGFKTHIWKPIEYRSSMSAAMDNVKLIVEPGNAIVRTAATYVVRVVGVRVSGKSRIVRTNGSFLHVGRRCIAPEDIVAVVSGRKNVSRQTIVGCTCKESDVLGELFDGVELQVGDVVRFRNIGAYCMDEFGQCLVAAPDKKYVGRI